MKLYPENPDAQAAVEVLAPYYPYGVEVEHRVHGRGILLGFGFARLGESLKVRCHFPSEGDMDGCYEATDVKPVLIRATAFDMYILRTLAEQESLCAAIAGFRSMHFALGLKPGQYIEKPNPLKAAA
jgi:hypothetical protein